MNQMITKHQICLTVLSHKRRDFFHNIVRSSSIYPQKKDVSGTFPALPETSLVEKEWYDWWKANNFFRRPKSCPKFVMLLPPPNVTGKLHMGHAITLAIQDAIARWNQMSGKHVVWVPGCDHAGIATQTVVERHLLKTKNLTKHMLGKEQFKKEIEQWKEEKQENIYQQIEKMGPILDWNREYFTMDQVRSDAVNHAFIKLFESGMIYRGNYIINWCSSLNSVISDSEVTHKQINSPTKLPVPGYKNPIEFGRIYDIAYKIDNSDEEIVFSTTRPETIPGDTAIMVHPEDSRYLHLEGQMAVHPLNGTRIPIIFSTTVKKDMGTGAVKITPAHSADDFERGKEHNLSMPVIIDDSGNMDTPNIPEIHGKPCYEARSIILSMLSERNLLKKTEDHPMSVPICDRSGDVIQPQLKSQWFVKLDPMFEKLEKVLESNELVLQPASKYNVLRDFLSRKQDWCISRQLWWGHSIPVYWVSTRKDTQYGDPIEIDTQCSAFIAACSEDEAKKKGADALGVDQSLLTIQKETDVLDTWFSSSLLPLSAFEWPHNQENFENHYPNTMVETGEDILFFWITKMVMMGLELTGKLPFKTVMFHGLFADSRGKKMSKSVGNVVDPIDVMNFRTGNDKAKSNPLGIDALRFALCSFKTNRELLHWDMRLAIEHYFVRNKLWQSCKFFIANSEGFSGVARTIDSQEDLHTLDKWILSRLACLIERVDTSFKNLDDGLPSLALKNFWINEFCNIYLTVAKLRLQRNENNPDEAKKILRCCWTCLNVGLRLFHPFMPFITEELYQRIPSDMPKQESILQCDYPNTNNFTFPRDLPTEELMSTFLNLSQNVRSFRGRISKKCPNIEVIHLYVKDPELAENLRPIWPEFVRLSTCKNIELGILDPSTNLRSKFSANLDCGTRLVAIPQEEDGR